MFSSLYPAHTDSWSAPLLPTTMCFTSHGTTHYSIQNTASLIVCLHRQINPVDRADRLYPIFKSHWEECVADARRKNAGGDATAKPSLPRALLKTVGVGRVILAITMYLVGAAVAFIPPLLLEALINHFEQLTVLSDGTCNGHRSRYANYVEYVSFSLFLQLHYGCMYLVCWLPR